VSIIGKSISVSQTGTVSVNGKLAKSISGSQTGQTVSVSKGNVTASISIGGNPTAAASATSSGGRSGKSVADTAAVSVNGGGVGVAVAAGSNTSVTTSP
jgi:hypothetical protein